MRRAVIIVIVLAGVLVVGWFALRHYVRSSRQVADKVAAQLQQAYGGNVKLQDVDIGLASSALNRVEFFEIECTADAAGNAWLTVGSFETDISIFDLIQRNALPKRVKLSDVKLDLRFTRDGKLRTCLPEQFSLERLEEVRGQALDIGKVPVVELVNSQIALHTEGVAEPDLVFKNVHARLEKKQDALVLEGSMDCDGLGKWTVTGRVEANTTEPTIVFKSLSPVDGPALSARLPFLPAGFWREHPKNAPIQLRVIFDLHQGKLFVRP